MSIIAEFEHSPTVQAVTTYLRRVFSLEVPRLPLFCVNSRAGCDSLRSGLILARCVMQGLESTGPCVQGIRDIGLHNYLEFSAVTSALTLHQGRLCGIPASRADVHAASWLSAEGKRNLNLFLSTAQQAAAGSVSEIFQSSHFKAAMDEFGLPESVQVRFGTSSIPSRWCS